MRWVLLSIAAVVMFTVFTVVYSASAPANRVRVLPKWAWVILCLVTTPVGGILYLIFGRPVGPAKGTRKGPLAPDDDPDFLRNLRDQLDDDSDGEAK